MASPEQEARNKAFVRHIYDASFGGDPSVFLAAMHEDFEERVPPILPWGGVHRGPNAFVTDVAPKLSAAVDLPSTRLVSLSADGDHVVALLNAKSKRGEELWIAEHWTLRDGKAWRLMVFYHDTTPLLNQP